MLDSNFIVDPRFFPFSAIIIDKRNASALFQKNIRDRAGNWHR